MRGQFSRDGFAVVERVFDDELGTIIALLEQLPKTNKVRRKVEVYGVRNLFNLLPPLVPLLLSHKIRSLVEPILGPHARAVRSILFDKPQDANWMVPWHRDFTIAVKGRKDMPGFGPWSVKAGIVHAQPPAEHMANMLAVRIHIDDCTAENGALEVLPGSHANGRLSGDAIHHMRISRPATLCAVPRGGCLLMRPLLVHASRPSLHPQHRRVIHIELSSDPLPGGLEWHEWIAFR